MSAYSHSRLREILLSGVIKHILSYTNLVHRRKQTDQVYL